MPARLIPLGHLFTTAQHRVLDAQAARHGVSVAALMENAGLAVAGEIQKRWRPRPAAVLCGPGANGGDGFVAARVLQRRGWPVEIYSLKPLGELAGPGRLMAERWLQAGGGELRPLEEFAVTPLTQAAARAAGAPVIVDALFGAGLSKPAELPVLAELKARAGDIRLVAVDLPSGLDGDTGHFLSRDPRFHGRAELTVTFGRAKPGHCLGEGPGACGELVLADIGFPRAAFEQAEASGPRLWVNPRPSSPRLEAAHKYERGHVGVLTGGPHSTGAARLSALAALASGAGVVKLLCPEEAAFVCSAHMAAVMVRPHDSLEAFADSLERIDTVVLGPAAGPDQALRDKVRLVAERGLKRVYDADVFTAFAGRAAELFDLCDAQTVLTPHLGEFKRVFPDLLSRLEHGESKAAIAMAAAERAGCTVLLKGPDTCIASGPDRCWINTHASPNLATAGSGDVLAGMIAGRMGSEPSAEDAARSAAWLHGEVGLLGGAGLTADRMLDLIPAALSGLLRSGP